jgi:uncharacterized protein (DUF488 family)
MGAIKIFTIGTTKVPAETFFKTLHGSGVRKVIDVRLNNTSQLAGFSKRDDLVFFLEKILGLPYEHRKELAPTASLLDAYKRRKIGWKEYSEGFMELLRGRKVETVFTPTDLDSCVLLCNDYHEELCHRRLAVEYLRDQWTTVEVRHLRPQTE